MKAVYGNGTYEISDKEARTRSVTKTQIETVAAANDMTVNTVINGVFSETEKLAVNMGSFKTAFFVMDNKTFDYNFEKVYNAMTDKTSKKIPKIFKHK